MHRHVRGKDIGDKGKIGNAAHRRDSMDNIFYIVRFLVLLLICGCVIMIFFTSQSGKKFQEGRCWFSSGNFCVFVDDDDLRKGNCVDVDVDVEFGHGRRCDDHATHCVSHPLHCFGRSEVRSF